MASEAVKIKLAQLKYSQNIVEIHAVEIHAFVFNEKLKQLKSDLSEKWFLGYEEIIPTDLKKYLEQFYKDHNVKPERQSELEQFDYSSDEFKETLTSVAQKLNLDGKIHIILMDEVDLKNVMPSEKSTLKNNLEIDLSFVGEFHNVHFIFCLRSAIEGMNNFTQI